MTMDIRCAHCGAYRDEHRDAGEHCPSIPAQRYAPRPELYARPSQPPKVNPHLTGACGIDAAHSDEDHAQPKWSR